LKIDQSDQWILPVKNPQETTWRHFARRTFQFIDFFEVEKKQQIGMKCLKALVV
jgi:hypothetical protein